MRTVVTGTHTGDYRGVTATGEPVQTSVSHILRVRGDVIVDHWHLMDSYRLLVRIGRIPGVAAGFQAAMGVNAGRPSGADPRCRRTRPRRRAQRIPRKYEGSKQR